MRASGDGEWSVEVELGIHFYEFVAIIALMMALTALSIDVMLPALPRISESFALANPNDRQAVIMSYLLGFSAGQLIYGPLSDRFGRKPTLMVGLVIFACGALAASIAPDFRLLLLARAAQGLGGAGPRVISLAIVRDLFYGREMARVMSFAMMVFVIVPVVAPAVGQGVLMVGPWQWNFYLLVLAAIILMAWAALRLPETHRPEAFGGARRVAPGMAKAFLMVIASPQTVGYAMASAFMLGCLMSYIGCAQQIFVDVFELGSNFPVVFGAVASVMAAASFTNSQLVMRLGMRRVSHSALTGFIAASLALTLLSVYGKPSLAVFCVLLATAFFMFGLIVSNFNAIAMEPQGAVAGTAASVIGFFTSAMAALFGTAIGRLFDGGVLPLAAGFTMLGLGALLSVLAVEGWSGMFGGE
jgi:DHA1 family bicyclomycin/chloramphenicol resistance-like MFS transporter